MNHELFTQLLESNRDRIYSHALYCLRDPEDAQDVTQDTFVKLWHKFGNIDPGKAPGWLMRVVHNLCIDLIRRRQSQRNNFGYPDPDALEMLPSSGAGPDPEERFQLDLRQRALLDAMETLPADTRSVMVMHYFQEMKLHEIAEVLDKTVSALKVQIHRARKSLRLVLTTRYEPGLDVKRETG
jgi:RNA polymerase sigma-70 factor (ECF subfamily)